MEHVLSHARRQVKSELYHLELVMRESYLDLQQLIDKDPANYRRNEEYINACVKRMKMLETELHKQIDAIEQQYFKEKKESQAE